MFKNAQEMGLQRAMTFIVGMGETREDLTLLKNFITKYGINKIHIYGLIPQAGTPFEKAQKPTVEEQAWWISQLRIAFPTLDIQCGIWEDRIEYVSTLLKSGANTISKFKATKLFGSELAKEIEHQSILAGRTFKGTLTKLPDVDWQAEIQRLSIDSDTKEKIWKKLQLYLQKMK